MASKHLLHVVVHSACDLLAKDLYGTSDPFVKVYVDQVAVAQTKTLKGDLNPVFNQHFEVELDKLPAKGSKVPELKLEVLNEYRFGKVTGAIQNIGKDSFLGQVVLPVSQLLDDEVDMTRTWHVLQKRSSKSRVRGRLQLTLYIVEKGSNSLCAPVIDVPRLGRRSSHYSVAELAEVARLSPEQRIKPGRYKLLVALVKASELPIVDKSKHFQLNFQVGVEGSKGKSPDYQAQNIDADGLLDLSEFEMTAKIDLKDVSSLPNVRLSLSLPQSGLFDYTLGRTSIGLGNIPVLPEDDQGAIDALVPVDVYLEKSKVTLLPPYMHLRGRSGSVCRLRVKLWLVSHQSFGRAGSSGSAPDDEDDEGDDQDLDQAYSVPTDLSALPAPYEWTLVDETYNVAFARVHRAIFGDNSKFFNQFCHAKSYTEVSVSPWSDEGKREVAYLIAASSLVKANHAVESQEYIVKPETEGLCVVHVTTETPEVTCGKDFVVTLQYILQKTKDKQCHLKITGQVKFAKRLMLSSVINKGAKSGLTSTFDIFNKTLQASFSRKKKAARSASPSEGADTSAVSAPGTGSGAWLTGLFTSLQPILYIIIVVLLAIALKLWERNTALEERASTCERLLELSIRNDD